MKRLLANTLMLAGGLTLASHSLALGLGELELDSALNQPLKAEIALVEAEDLSQWEIKPKLASPQDFESAGVDRVFFLTKIDFKVDGDKIVLSTREPVTEPFLNFLVELNWPAGRVLREYTVLLDPPTFADNSVAPLSVTTPATVDTVYVEQPGTETVEQTEIVTTGSSVDRQDWTQEPSAPGTYKVKPNDTLWNIALQNRPDRSVSPQRMMVAIQQANPDAFIGGNINRLKTHKVLRIPGIDEVNAIAEQQAMAEVERQNKDLNASAAQLSATGRSTSAEPTATSQTDGEVRLLSPTEKQRDIAGSSGEVASDSVGGREQAVENDLALAMEDLDRSRRENQELRERLEALESQIETLQRLITLKDDQLANMQLSDDTDTADESMEMGGDQQMMDDDEGMPSDSSLNQQDEVDFNYTEPSSEVTPEPESYQPDAEPSPSVEELAAAEERRRQLAEQAARDAQRRSEPSLMDTLLSPVVLGITALVALLLGWLGLRAVKKRKESAADSEEALEIPASEIDVPADAGHIDDFDFDDEELDQAPVDLASSDDAPADEFDGVEDGEDFSPVAQTEDVISESDIYIAYGKFDQAVELLTGAIEEESSRTDLRLKLLEVLVEMDDSQAFAEAEGALNLLGDHQANDQAMQMRSRLSSPQAPTGSAEPEVPVMSLDDDVPELSDSLGDEFNDGLDFADALESSDSDLGEATDDIFSQSGDDEVGSADALEFDASLDFGSDDSSSSDAGLEDVPTLDLDADLGESLDFDLGDSAGDFDEAPAVEEAASSDSEAEDGLEFDLSGFGESDDEAGELDTLEQALEGSADLDESLEFDLGSLQQEDDSPEEVVEPAAATDSSDDNVLDFSVGDFDPEAGQEADGLAELEAELEQSSFDASSLPEVEPGTEEVTDAGDFMAELESMSESAASDAGDFDLSADMADLDGDLQDFTAAQENEPEATVAAAPEAPKAMPEETPSVGGRATDDIDLDELAAADDEFDFLAGTDECATKLDLARAYIDMEDAEGAKELLQEVLQEGSDQQKQEARGMMDKMS